MYGALTRREFIRQASLYGGSLWIAMSLPRSRALAAAAASEEPVTFTAEQWKLVEAITARIIPTDEDPGAVEAGCVNFIDKALADEDAAAKPLYAGGLAALQAVCAAQHEKSFAELSADEQDQVLASLQDGTAKQWPTRTLPAPQFFETVRLHTIIGFLADPKYGGNRDYAGWKLLGYPGPSHLRGGYTVEQMSGKAAITAVWGEEV